jgi:hypothetical protein
MLNCDFAGLFVFKHLTAVSFRDVSSLPFAAERKPGFCFIWILYQLFLKKGSYFWEVQCFMWPKSRTIRMSESDVHAQPVACIRFFGLATLIYA